MPLVENSERASKPYELALIFTGHMVDLPGRASPRFPSAMEVSAAAAIRHRIAFAKKAAHGSVCAIASAARGGDILFLEACRKLGIEIRIVLPFSRKRFRSKSVAGAPEGHWEHRFERLWNAVPPSDRQVLRPPDTTNAYDFCNKHILSLAHNLAAKVQLLALWDGQESDARPGGTASLIDRARRSGGRVTRIDAQALLRNMQLK